MYLQRKYFINYLIIAFGCFLLVAFGLSLTLSVQDYNILACQFVSIISFVFFVYIGKKLTYRCTLPLIFIFQLIFSYLLYWDFKNIVGHILGYNPVDSLLYLELAGKTSNLSLERSLEVLSYRLDSLSDYGFPFFLKYVYWAAGGVETGHKLLIFLNCCFQTIICYWTGQIARNVGADISTTKMIVLLWGINPCSVYLNVSGLKEPLFCLLCIAIMWNIYQCHKNRSLIKHMFLLALIGMTWFFRNYMTFFLLFIYIGYDIFPFLYKKSFFVICVVSLIVCIGFTSVLIDFFPEIYYVMLQSEEVLPSGIGKYMYYVLAFLAPIPKFFNVATPQMLIIVVYSILKYSCSIFAIIGSWYWIKTHAVKYFPLINIFLFSVIMLIVSAHYIDYRYAYPIMPCFFILMVEGAKYCKKRIAYSYLLFSAIIVIMFNMQLY